MVKYDSYPLGQIPKEFQRPEIDQLKKLGYDFDDAREIIGIFEKKVAKFAGCKYAVAVDCCSHGIFLALKYLDFTGESLRNWNLTPKITVPRHTYISIPMQIKQANFNIEYEDLEWSGVYQLKPTRIWDGSVRWTKGMYVGEDAIQIVSFQLKKRIPIGKGGMILTNDKDAAEWFKLASYDGRDLTLPYTHPEHIKMLGYHMYMTPEDAARGIMLMDMVSNTNEDSGNNTTYPDVEQMINNIKF